MENDNDPVVSPEGVGHDEKGDPTFANSYWNGLALFKVRCKEIENARTQLYSNGNQHVQITVDVIATHNGQEVQLSLAQLDSIELISYVGGGSMPLPVHANKPNSYIHEFAVSPTRAPAAGGGGEDGLQNGVQRKTYWISANIHNVGTHKIAARMRTSGGVVYTTNTPNPTPGKFDSYLILDCIQPVVHHAKDLHVDRIEDGHQAQMRGFIWRAQFIDHPYRVAAWGRDNDGYDTWYFYSGRPKDGGDCRRYHMVENNYIGECRLDWHTGPIESLSIPSGVAANSYLFRALPEGTLSVLMITHELFASCPVRGGHARCHAWDQYGNKFGIEWYVTDDGRRADVRDW